MANVKQIFLGVAVAGVLGAGASAGVAVAAADPSGSDASSSSASENTGRGGSAPGRSHTPADSPAPAASPATTHRSARAAARAEEAEPPQAADDDAPLSPQPARGGAEPEPAAAQPEPPAAEAPAPQEQTPAAGAESGAVAPPAPAAEPESPPAPPGSAEPVVAVDVSATVAEVAALTAAPADPSPTPLTLPLLPDLPAVPVAPVSAVTVSATSGANPRLRAASAVGQAGVLTDPPTHVLLIGTDGTNLDKVLEYAYTDGSGFKTLMDEGVTGATSIVGHTTISGPSWSTILTGVWDSKTGVINNLFRPEPYTAWPTVVNLIEYNKPAVDTAVIADWQFISDIAGAGGYPADTNTYVAPVDKDFTESSAKVTADTIAKIQQIGASPDVSTFVFSYQVEVDEAGHAYGGGSPEYRQAVINVGENIEQIVAAVKEVEAATGQDWTIIVTTDHGHQQSQGFGHGFQSPNETSSFVIFDLAGDAGNDGKQNLRYSTVDITPTIVQLFGVPLRSDFDGKPMQTDTAILDSIVTPVNLRQSLDDAISMYGYPNLGAEIKLGTRTVVASVPYLLDGLVTGVTDFLRGIADQDIFLISGLAGVTELIVAVTGDIIVGVTNTFARGVAELLGSGVIPPSDPPLPAPPANSELPASPGVGGDSEFLLLLDGAVLA